MATPLKYKIKTFLLVATIAVGCWGGADLSAQSNVSGFQNIASHRQASWRSVSTDHFDVHYTYDDPVLAQAVARFAEDALWDHCRLLDYNNKTRYAFYLVGGPAALAQSNLFPSSSPKSGGITPIRSNSTPVVFPGSYEHLQKKVRSEVARMMMEDFYFGGGIQASIQNTVLLHLPEWYGEGLPAYLGEGWSYDDELVLSSLENTNLLDYVLEGNEPIHRVARKSIWYFIETQYGREKLAEIFYMTRLARGAEDGVVHVLGITLKTLTDRWREFVLHRITENAGFREKLSEQAAEVDLETKGRIVSLAVNPVEPLAAVCLEQDGKHQVILKHLQRGTESKTPVRFGRKTNQFGMLAYDVPMAWSPDGQQLVLVGWNEKEEVLYHWNRSSGALKLIRFQPRIDHILSIDWSHDGASWVLSGLKSGQIEIFLGKSGGNSFEPLTDDIHDDLHPVFSQDDQRIYFASTRSNDSKGDSPISMDARSQTTDIWEMNLADRSIRQVSHSPWVDEVPVRAVSSFELLVRTNLSGIWNLEKRNVFSGDSIPQTNLANGIEQAQVNDSLALIMTAVEGENRLFQAPVSQLLKPVVSLKTQHRLRDDKQRLLQLKVAQQQQARDSLPKVEPAKIKDAKLSADSAKVKYYVFDEDDSQKPKRSNNRPRASLIKKTAPIKPDFSTLAIKGPQESKLAWSAERVSTRIGYDPIFRISSNFEARLIDQKGDHAMTFGFTPFMDLRSADTYLRYQNNKHRLDYWAGLDFSTRFLNRLDFSLRSNSSKLQGGVILPLNRYLSLDASAHMVHLSRSNLNIRVPSELDGREVLTGIQAGMQYDRTRKNGLFVQEGSFARVSMTDVASLKGRYNQFATVSWDLRKYLPVQHFVFANRLSGALSWGRHPQRYFVGGTEDWFFGRFNNPSDYPIGDALGDFHYMSYGAPIRGFRFNARNGSRNLVYNAELRMPVSRIFKRGLNTDPLYKLEIIPFFDLGTAWTNGNPFSQRNPIDTEIIDSYPVSITVQTLKSPFVMGFGAGTRMQLFGYGVRFDLAWGVEDYTVQKPILHISLGKNF